MFRSWTNPVAHDACCILSLFQVAWALGVRLHALPGGCGVCVSVAHVGPCVHVLCSTGSVPCIYRPPAL